MKIFHNEEIYIKTDNFSDSIFKENTMFFDIETTGFSPVKAIVYMIGCARRIKNRIVIDQYFAESVDDEAAVIEAFAGSLSGCSTIISFNGVGFDIDERHDLSYGLNNIEERVDDMAGTMTLLSQKGKGVSMDIRLPLVKGENKEKEDGPEN